MSTPCPLDGCEGILGRREAIIDTVALTLRQIAGWGDMSATELHQIADQVTRLNAGDIPCPMCEEITCDDGCPLAAIRAAEA